MPGGRRYQDILTLGQVDHQEITYDPNGLFAGALGSVVCQRAGGRVTMWQNVDGGTTWIERMPHPGRTLTVAMGTQTADYSTIKAALAAAVAGDTVLVSPGDYVEQNPLVMPQGVALVSTGGTRVTHIYCANPNSNGIEMDDQCWIMGFRVHDASGVGAAAYYAPPTLNKGAIWFGQWQDCYYGVHSQAAASDALTTYHPRTTSGVTNTAFYCSAGGYLNVLNFVMTDSVTCACVFKADGVGSLLKIRVAVIDGALTVRSFEASNTGVISAQVIRIDSADEGAFILATGGTFTFSAVQFMGTVVGNHLNLANTALANCILIGCYLDTSKIVKGALATLEGNYEGSGTAARGPTLLGDTWLGFTPDEQVPLTKYIRATAFTGWVSGGEVTVNAGRVIDVATGVGYVNTGTGEKRFEWVASIGAITIDPNTDFWVYVSAAGVLGWAAVEPSYETNILLATGRTSAAAIVMLAQYHVNIKHAIAERHEYAMDNFGALWVSGLTVTNPAGLGLAVDQGEYYLGDLHLSPGASASPTPFTYWYNGAGGWVAVPASVAIDDAQYNSFGVGLVGIPGPNPWKKDRVFVVVEPDGTPSYHVVYAQATYANQGLAEAAVGATAPPFFDENAMVLAGPVVQSAGAVIASIMDERPYINTVPPTVSVPTVHGTLAGLAADDHGQYVLLAGNAVRNAFTGTFDMVGGTLQLPVSAAPVQTFGGAPVWDSVLKVLTIGDSVARVTMVDTTTAQVLGNKTLTTPTIGSMVNANHDHGSAAGGGLIVQATEILRGAAEVATQVETDAGVLDTVMVTPLKLKASPIVQATEILRGGAEVATQVEADALADDTVMVTPSKLGALTAYIANLIVRKIRTTTGPTDMVVGAVADGQTLRRVGATLVGTNQVSQDYGPLAADPVGVPAAGDTYYNTALGMAMAYDAVLAKWLSITLWEMVVEASGNTSANAYFTTGGLAMSAASGRYMPWNATITAISYTRSDSDAATFEVYASGVATGAELLSAATSGSTTALNSNTAAGAILALRNKNGGNTVSNVRCIVRGRWRA